MDLSQAYTENSHGSHQSGPQRAYGAGPSSPKAAQSWDALQHNGALSPPLPGHGHALRSGDAGKPGIAYVSGAGRPPTTISMDDSEWASQYRQPHAVTSPTRPVPSRAGASGLRAAPSVLTRHTLRGVAGPPAHGVRRLWAWVPASIPIRLFLLVTLLESGVDIAIEVVLLSRFRTQEGGILGSNFEGVQPALPVFVMVFCLAHVYQCALAVDAVINRNTILIFGLVIFNIAFFVYSVIQISEIRLVLGTGVAEGTGQHVPVQVLTALIPAVIGVSSAIFSVLSFWIYRDFGWDVYRSIVGADRDLKRAHMHYQVFVALLKADFFVFIAYCLQLVLIVLQGHNAEYWLTVVAAPFALIILGFAWYSVRRELRYGMMAFMTLLLGAGAYFCYKLYRIWAEHEQAYSEVYKSLTVFSVLAIALVLATMWFSVRCLLNFDRGLKAAMDRAHAERAQIKRHERSTRAGGAGGVDGIPMEYDGKGMMPLGSASTLNLPGNRLSLD